MWQVMDGRFVDGEPSCPRMGYRHVHAWVELGRVSKIACFRGSSLLERSSLFELTLIRCQYERPLPRGYCTMVSWVSNLPEATCRRVGSGRYFRGSGRIGSTESELTECPKFRFLQEFKFHLQNGGQSQESGG
jgi:hypothetical protein